MTSFLPVNNAKIAKAFGIEPVGVSVRQRNFGNPTSL